MALGDSYPVELLDDQGNRVATEVAAVQFTDGADQPSRSGGGSQPPDSWLLAEVSTPLTESGNLEWALLGGAGSDLEIDGDDDSLVNILTPGNYTILVYNTNFQGDVTGYGFAAVVLQGTVLDQDWLAARDGAPENGVLVVPPSFQYYGHFDAPAVQVAAPCNVQVGVTIGPNGGTLTDTITVGSGTHLLVRRNA